jgi:hypothetical protein
LSGVCRWQGGSRRYRAPYTDCRVCYIRYGEILLAAATTCRIGAAAIRDNSVWNFCIRASKKEVVPWHSSWRQLGYAPYYERALTIAWSLTGGAPILIGTPINAQEKVKTLDAEIIVDAKVYGVATDTSSTNVAWKVIWVCIPRHIITCRKTMRRV